MPVPGNDAQIDDDLEEIEEEADERSETEIEEDEGEESESPAADDGSNDDD